MQCYTSSISQYSSGLGSVRQSLIRSRHFSRYIEFRVYTQYTYTDRWINIFSHAENNNVMKCKYGWVENFEKTGYEILKTSAFTLTHTLTLTLTHTLP